MSDTAAIKEPTAQEAPVTEKVAGNDTAGEKRKVDEMKTGDES